MLFRSVVRRVPERVELTERQFQIVALVARGLSDRDIAATLKLSVRTVSNYLSEIYVRAECRNRTELAVRAVAADFVVRSTSGRIR